jgi:hypothetical protein
MKWIALVTWVLTAGGGFGLLGLWLRRGGTRRPAGAGNRIRPPLIFSHFGLAALGLVLWIVYVITDNDALKWAAFVVIAIVAVLGWTMFAIWYQRRRKAVPAGSGPGASSTWPTSGNDLPAEQHFPIWLVTVHGVLAVLTVLLVLLTAIGVGGS